MKECCDCGIEKPAIDFTKVGRNADGLDIRCRACRKIQRDLRLAPIRDQRTTKPFNRCRSCGIVKPASDFSAPRARVCLACRAAQKNALASIPKRPRKTRGPAERFDDPPGYKTCRQCRERKPVEMFGLNARVSDGRQSYCRTCANAQNAARRERRREATRVPKAWSLPDGMKQCRGCAAVLPVDEFFHTSRSRDGYEAQCKDCDRKRRNHAERYVDLASAGFKTCRTCGEVKIFDAFYEDPRQLRGVAGQCKECRLNADEGRRRQRGISALERFNDPEGMKTCRNCRTLRPVIEFRPYQRNADGISSWCIECANARTLQWHKDNPAAIMAMKVRRRLREDADAREVTDRDITRLLDRWDNRCAYCGASPQELHLDHVVPLARGGRHSIGNLVPACPSCNSSKGAKLLVEWRRRQRGR